jgi:hypothetical protein
MMSKRFTVLVTIAVVTVSGVASAIYASSHDFVPDVIFKGSSLTGWHTLGPATWRAENGEIIGTPKPEGGGWLVLDKGYQDVQFYTTFLCSGPCKAGVLMRAHKNSDGGMTGVYVSLDEGDVASYQVTLNSEGKELSRSRLRPAPAPMIRMAAAPSTAGQEAVVGFSKLAPTRAEEEARAEKLASRPPTPPGAAAPKGRGGRGGPSLRANEWNTVQIILDADQLGFALNGGRGGANGVTEDQMMGFGPLALYAGGPGEVRFKEVSYKDLNPKFEPQEKVSANFRM